MAELKKTCRSCAKEFIVSDWEREFLQKMDMPLPTLCVTERHQKRLSRRNERTLYKGECALSGDSIISIYSPAKNLTVYSQEAWWGDKWDGRDYGRDYDFSRPFFEQFAELQRSVPRLSLMNTRCENSAYCNITTDNKNCYLLFGGDFNEDCIYSVFCFHSKDSSDLYWVDRSELVYECTDCEDCYNCKYCRHAYNCRDSAFLYDCRGCQNCFGCMGLRNKQYCFFNNQYSKEQYEQKIKEYDLGSRRDVGKAERGFEAFLARFANRAVWLINCENSSGNNLINCKNAHNCFDLVGPVEDAKDVILGGWNMKDILSSDHLGHGIELTYEVLGCVAGYRYAFSTFIWNSRDVFYSDMIVNNSHDIFGCSNLKKAEYCILNKQYTKEEYFELRARIVEHMKSTGEWGEFFPIKDSLFAYNETIANDYIPMSQQEVLANGWSWKEEEKRNIGSGDELPDSIDEVDETVLTKTFVCKATGRPYRINDTELKLYKRLRIPLPEYAPETRNERRFRSRAPWSTHDDRCQTCGETVRTSSRQGSIVCEKCYEARYV